MLGLSFFAQTKISYEGDSSYSLVERTNLRRYVNGKYSGLTSREVRSFISLTSAPEGARGAKSDRWYDGNFFVMEETLRNSRSVMAGIHEAIPSVFKIDSDGKMTMFEDRGYPTFRSFPAYPSQPLKPGDSWKGEGERAVDPMNKGIFTRMPILALYTFEGEEMYRGERVYKIKAIWQTNYLFSNFNADPRGDQSLKRATGGHKADILVRASSGEAILINDNVDESFLYMDGTQVDLKGTITLFTEYPPAIDRDKLIFALNRIAKADTAAEAAGAQKKSGLAKKESGAGKNQGKEKKAGAGGKADPVQAAGLQGGSQVASAKKVADSRNSLEEGRASGDGGGKSLGGSKNQGKSSGSGAKNPLGTGKSPDDGKENSALGGNRSDLGGDNSFGDAKSQTAVAKTSSAEKKSLSEKAKSSSAGDSSKNNMVYEETEAGIRLSVRDVKFKPDSGEVLPSEKGRLDEIAAVLKLAPQSHFLIEGHTASVGKPAGEQKLSEERAKNIALELSKRGIPADKFICKGHGGNKPIASNATDEGRAKNRRVEITILE